MKKIKYGTAAVWIICALLTLAAFFAKDFVLYDFQMMPFNYAYTRSETKPAQASSALWFTLGADRELQYGYDDGIDPAAVLLYGKTEAEVQPLTSADMAPIREDLIGYFVAALPARQENGRTVHDFARADIGPHTYELAPREFNIPEIPFEVAYAERKYIQVFYQNQLLTDAEVTVTDGNGSEAVYRTDDHGWISGLPIETLRSGFTASYSPDGQNVYRMYYLVEDYEYFTVHFFKAHIPLLIILALTALGIVIVCFLREWYCRKDPAYAVYGRERPSFGVGHPLRERTNSKFLLIRWLFLIFGFFFWTYAGKIIHQGQALNQIAVPVFSCPFNLDQTLESSCYYLTHLPILFTRNWGYILCFLGTLFLSLIFLGRMLCGFMCPLGLLQDLMDQLRKVLHIRPIQVTDRMNKAIQPPKWLWIVLFLGFVFVGGDFCDICPNKVFSTALGGWWASYALTGFLSVFLLVGSFFIKRFWCLMCPMGYLLGIFYKFNLFKLKKNCTACTECGACYEACPMRLKNIYTERDKADVQTVDCLMCGECIHKCPENNALRLTFCGKDIYKSSRKAFISKYAPKTSAGKERQTHGK